MPIELNALETKRFGTKAAHVIDDAAALTLINDTARSLNVDMLTIRIGTEHLRRLQALEDDGFRLMDTLVYYSRPLSDLPPSTPFPEQEIIRPAIPGDVAAVSDVARSAFENYIGHYHADPRLSDAAADAAYVEWAETSIANCAKERPAYVVEQDGHLIAFMTVRIEPDGLSEIILNGVKTDIQGTGVYGRLLEYVMQALQDMGCKRLLISTQINNIAVQKAWGRRGLRMSHSYYTLHKWL